MFVSDDLLGTVRTEYRVGCVVHTLVEKSVLNVPAGNAKLVGSVVGGVKPLPTKLPPGVASNDANVLFDTVPPEVLLAS